MTKTRGGGAVQNWRNRSICRRISRRLRQLRTNHYEYSRWPSVTNTFEPALYQMVRAGIGETNLTAASRAVDKLLAWFPEGPGGQPSLLLLGEAQDRTGMAEDARKTFSGFIANWPESRLRPEVDLAIARTYERENDWTNAINRRRPGWRPTQTIRRCRRRSFNWRGRSSRTAMKRRRSLILPVLRRNIRAMNWRRRRSFGSGPTFSNRSNLSPQTSPFRGYSANRCRRRIHCGARRG